MQTADQKPTIGDDSNGLSWEQVIGIRQIYRKMKAKVQLQGPPRQFEMSEVAEPFSFQLTDPWLIYGRMFSYKQAAYSIIAYM